MTALIGALRAEAFKLRRTLALWMVLATPLIPVILQFFMLLDRGKPGPNDAWPGFIQSIVALWSVFLLPLFIALETALLNGLEHQSGGWKQMFALPLRRWHVFLAKVTTATVIVAAAFTVLYAFSVLAGTAVHVLRPELNMSGGIPWGRLLSMTSGSCLASLFIVVVHSWVSARFRGFPLPLGVGIGATFFAVFATSARWGTYYPWLLPLNSILPERASMALVLGPLGALLTAAVMLIDLSRRDVP